MLPAAIFFELIWLDLFHVGTYVPPMSLLSYLAFVPLAVLFDFKAPQDCVLLLVLCLPLASLGGRLEQRLRVRQGADYHELLGALEREDAVRKLDGILGRMISGALLRQTACFGFVYLLAVSLLFFILWLVGVKFGIWPVSRPFSLELPGVPSVMVNWGIFWVAAALGGLLSLRIRWALACFIAGAAAIAVFLLL